MLRRSALAFTVFLLVSCGDDASTTNASPFPSTIDDENIGDPPDWVAVADDDGDEVGYVRDSLDRPTPAPVYNRDGRLVGTFGCENGGGEFNELGSTPTCTPVTSVP